MVDAGIRGFFRDFIFGVNCSGFQHYNSGLEISA
jgi:hypothetical protein